MEGRGPIEGPFYFLPVLGCELSKTSLSPIELLDEIVIREPITIKNTQKYHLVDEHIANHHRIGR
jgi:hypothetical protein